jgi:FkbM family methyltransferase
MINPIRAVAQRLLATESPWNPKVIAGRVAAAVLPDGTLHEVKKAYYARLVARLPEDFLETDAPFVRHLVSAGDHVVDIGASIGAYTKFLSGLVGSLGRVWSFEPITETFEFLANNVNRLGLQNVTPINLAISDVAGREKMVVPTYRWGTDCFYDARIASAPVYDRHSPVKPSWKSEEVRSTTLDSFFRSQERRISFIKCDANFHELACLRGGLRILRDSKPAMLIEIRSDPDDLNTTGFETFSLLRDEGYGAYWFDGRTLRDRHPAETSQNYFFLTSAHVASLQAEGLFSPSKGR